MSIFNQRKIPRILFDEFHSESWSASEARSREMQPENPSNSSYQIAADALAERDFIVQRNIDQPLHKNILSTTDVLALVHPCDSKWERTTSKNSPILSPREISDIHEFVWNGGGLLVIAEYEHDKYGDNLNDLLLKFGLQIENTTVFDRSTCLNENPNWCFSEPAEDELSVSISHLVHKVCLYLAGSCTASDGAKITWRTSEKAMPQHAGIVGQALYGKGCVVLVTDSSLFGDEHIRSFSHLQFWLNLVYWCSAPAFDRAELVVDGSVASKSSSWISLKSTMNQLRILQKPDGSVDTSRYSDANRYVQSILKSIQELENSFPHQRDYLNQAIVDFQSWVETGFQKPDFGRSLALFNPVANRRNHIENLVVFPLYTPNASLDTRFEALIMRVPWPDWLAELERTVYRNDKFIPGNLVDFTDGYQSECAVLFPETVSLKEKPTNHFSVIFCDRESKRLQSYTQKAAQAIHLKLHPQLECWLANLPLIQDTVALWDLIHDKSHSVGELPFDPFMIRQKSPFWMYGLEELRVDLRSFCEANRISKKDFPFAQYVTYAVLLDRIFRFPITGLRIRNYDALGGQLLFSFLHQKDVLIWSDNELTIKWDALSEAVHQLRDEITLLYKQGADCSKMNFWIAAHDLISKYVKPNVASKWRKESRVVNNESDPKKWISLVHDDEFPLGNFHAHLLRKMSV